MARFDEFADILYEQLKKEFKQATPASQNNEFPSEIDYFPSGFAWILGQKNCHLDAEIHNQNQAKIARSKYGVKVRPRPPHNLSKNQTENWAFFKSQGFELTPAFSLEELRRAWKKIALLTHPDQGGNAELFIKSQAAYQDLKQIFNT